jgi:hypothetical protein
MSAAKSANLLRDGQPATQRHREASRGTLLAQSEPHGCKASVLDCEHCQEQAWPDGSFPSMIPPASS